MNNWWGSFYRSNRAIVWAAAIAIILALGIFLKVKDEVTRFTLIMPIFAGFILFSILVTADEDLEDEAPAAEPQKKEERPQPISMMHSGTKSKAKKSSKK